MLRLDPVKFASHRMHWVGELDLMGMPRLLSACNTERLAGNVSVELKGELDWEEIPFLELSLSGGLPLVCQRCMAAYDFKIEVCTKLSPVRNEKAAESLSLEYDPLFCEDQELDLMDIVESELLLLLPVVPKHAVKNCSVQKTHWDYGKETSVQGANPFSQLKKFKK